MTKTPDILETSGVAISVGAAPERCYGTTVNGPALPTAVSGDPAQQTM